MINNRETKLVISLWWAENRGIFVSSLVFVLAGFFILSLSLISGDEESVEGKAEAHFYVADDTGNIPKLSVLLDDGNLASIAISSPLLIKLGDRVCLIKSRRVIGITRYRLKSKGGCY